MSSRFQDKNIRHRDKLVHQDPPQIHFSAYVTGGLKKLFTKINSHDASVLPLYEYGRFTDVNGHFVPEKDTLLASRYRVLGRVSSKTRGQSSVQIFAKDEFNSDSMVVIKILHKSWGHLAHQELHFLWSLNVADTYKASRVVQLLNFFELDDHFCLVFEPLIPEPVSRIFQGFHRDQQQNVIHADLKPENILLKSGSDLTSITVIDFGNAIHNKFKEVALYFKDFELQTLLYRAPEVLFGIPFGTEIDLWSLGCILAELYSGIPLFPGTSKIPIIKEMTRLLGPFPKDLFQKGKFYDDLKGYTDVCEQKNVSDVLFKKLGCRDYLFRDFLSGLLRYSPADRLTPLKAAQHPFLASELPIAFLMSSTHTMQVGNPNLGKKPALNLAPLDMEQLKPDLLQKVKFIKSPESENVKTNEVKISDPYRSTFCSAGSPRVSRRYYSLPDHDDRKTNCVSKMQRPVKIPPFNFSSDKKFNLHFSPKNENDHSQFNQKRTRQRHSKSLDEMREMSEGVKESSRKSSNAKRLQELMHEIQEVQEMVEEDMNQRYKDDTDSLELKRRRISDSYTHTQSTKYSRSRSLTSEIEKIGSVNKIENDLESILPSSQKFKVTGGDTFPSKFSSNKTSWSDKQHQTFRSAQRNDLQSRTVQSCEVTDFCSEETKPTPAPNLKNRESQMKASPNCSEFTPNHLGFSRIHGSPLSSDASEVRKLSSESLGGKNQQQVGGEREMTLAGCNSPRYCKFTVLPAGGNKNWISVSKPESDGSSLEGQSDDDLSKHFPTDQRQLQIDKRNINDGREADKRNKNSREADKKNRNVGGEADKRNRNVGGEADKRNRNVGGEARTSSYSGTGVESRSRSRKDLYKVKELMKANSPQYIINDERPRSQPVKITGNKDRNEVRVEELTSERKLQRVSRENVPKKRLMFSNALKMKKKRKKDTLATCTGERDFVSTQQGRKVLKNDANDPFQYKEQQISPSVKNRVRSVGDDCLSDSRDNLLHQLEEDNILGLGRESFSAGKPIQKRRKFSLDFSPVDRKNSEKSYNWTQNM
ncbi:serine/threonine-protein kinase pakF-like isoform X2 [Ostrea edulis]|uniref:serine/threonine-protein kinase pakF-like isoform X2 n=1 Tax=Ostrea edulis TaxID=37623 RepID=UPI0024AEAA4A|nr:serine/threonine-protein kinase pakF-like isoform X2 [Ostrea edulis]